MVQYQTQGPDKDRGQEAVFWRYLLDKNRSFLEENRLYDFSRRWLEFKFAVGASERKIAAACFLKLVLFHPMLGISRLYWPLRRLLALVPKVDEGVNVLDD